MKLKIAILVVISLFFSFGYSQTTQVFYSPNLRGFNSVYSINVSSSANFTSENMLTTTEFGDGSGIAGPTRCAAQNTAQNKNFVFVANEGSNSINVYEYDRITSNLVIKNTLIIPGFSEDLSLVTSVDGNFLFVASSHFLTRNIIYSYSINNITGELTKVFDFTFGEWISSSPLPLRISSISVSSDGRFLFVGFTSNGGYLGVFRINSDATLSQIGTVLQTVLNGKSSSFTVANNQMDKIYTAQGNELIVSVGVYGFDNGLILQELKTITYPIIGGATSVSISPDNSLLFVTTTNKVVVFPIDSNGFPNATQAYTVHNTESCLSVVGVNIARCGRIFVLNLNGFEVFQRISKTQIVLKNQWTLNLSSPGGATIIDGTENCCADPTQITTINIEPEYIIDCADEIPNLPPFTVTNSITYIVEKRYEVLSKCNGRPDVIINITIIDECGRQINATTRYTRIDKTPPKVEVVGGEGFYLECGDTVPTFNFDFISVSDDCSPLIVSCSSIFDIKRYQCLENKVGEASVQITYYDSSNNTTPGPVQKLFILDTIPPKFENFNDSIRVFDSTCQLPDLSNAPNVSAYDKCSSVVDISGPFPVYKACGVFELIWEAEDECGIPSQTSYFWKLTEWSKAPQFTNLQSNLDIYLVPNITNRIDLTQGIALTLSQSCDPNFDINNLFGNEETSVTISLKESNQTSNDVTNIYTATWKLVYCGNVSTFIQTITVNANSLSDISKIIWDSSVTRFKIVFI